MLICNYHDSWYFKLRAFLCLSETQYSIPGYSFLFAKFYKITFPPNWGVLCVFISLKMPSLQIRNVTFSVSNFQIFVTFEDSHGFVWYFTFKRENILRKNKFKSNFYIYFPTLCSGWMWDHSRCFFVIWNVSLV